MLEYLDELASEGANGDPEQVIMWTNKSLMNLSSEMKKQGYDVSHSLVRRGLKRL